MNRQDAWNACEEQKAHLMEYFPGDRTIKLIAQARTRDPLDYLIKLNEIEKELSVKKQDYIRQQFTKIMPPPNTPK
jgi:IS5 family transposase